MVPHAGKADLPRLGGERSICGWQLETIMLTEQGVSSADLGRTFRCSRRTGYCDLNRLGGTRVSIKLEASKYCTDGSVRRMLRRLKPDLRLRLFAAGAIRFCEPLSLYLSSTDRLF